MTYLLKGLSVYLIGMMGSGKSTVGQLLAEKLGYRFFDSDVLIERVMGQTINEIFANQGEGKFREIESQILGELSAYAKSVVATGGGIVLKPQNWSYLRQGLVIWLDVPLDVLMSRLEADNTRPLLKEQNPQEKLISLLEQRRSLYAEADLHIQIQMGQTPEEIVSQIQQQIPSVLKVNS